MIILFGYYYILGVFSLFVYFALRLARTREGLLRSWIRRLRGSRAWRSRRALVFAVWSDSFRHKVLYDEFVDPGDGVHDARDKAGEHGRSRVQHRRHVADHRPLPRQAALFLPVPGLAPARPGRGTGPPTSSCSTWRMAGALLALLYWIARAEAAGRGPAILSVALMATFPRSSARTPPGRGWTLHNLDDAGARGRPFGALPGSVPDDDRLSLLVLAAVMLLAEEPL